MLTLSQRRSRTWKILTRSSCFVLALVGILRDLALLPLLFGFLDESGPHELFL